MTAAFEIVTFALFAFVAVVGALGMATTMSMFRSGIFLMASFMGVAGLFILLSADLIGLLQIMMYIGGMLIMILFMVLFMHDPGGAMMAGMEMSLVESWFSKGLTPRAPEHSEHDHHERHDDDGMQQEQHAGHGMHHERHGDDEKRAAHGQSHGGSDGKMDMDGMDMSDMSMVTPVRSVAVWLAVAVAAVLVAMLLWRPAWRVVQATPDPDSARQVGRLLMEKYMVAFEGAGTLILIGIFGAVLLARPSSHPDDPSRRARVAVAANPEPIEDEALPPLPKRGHE